jgi:hypothetical protein
VKIRIRSARIPNGARMVEIVMSEKKIEKPNLIRLISLMNTGTT